MDWRDRAACLDEDPELFFPIGNTGPAILQIEEAKAVCRRCAVIDTCLKWAIESGQDAGVWGGTVRGRAPRAQAPQRPRPPRRLTHAHQPSRDGLACHDSRAAGRRRRTARRRESAAAARRTATRGAARLRAAPTVIRPRRSCTSDCTICVPSPEPRRVEVRRAGPRPSSVIVTCSSSSPGRRSRARPRRRPCRRRSARPCSTAFCTSSVRIIASAVASSARSRAERAPSRSARTGCSPRRPPRRRRGSPRPAIVVEVDRLVEALAQRLVHQRDRRPPGARPPRSAARASPSGSRRACSRSSAATVCRLFFTRWWISRIVASLVSSSRSRRRSSHDVAQQHERADPLPRLGRAGSPASTRVAPRERRPRCATARGR